MHTAHTEAEAAERFARLTADTSAAGAVLGTVLHLACRALACAERAQEAAGVPATTGPLADRIRQPETGSERRAREEESRRLDAETEARLTAETGMDLTNRARWETARQTAAVVVPALGWSSGLLYTMQQAATGAVEWRGGRAWTGRRPIAKHRVQLLTDAGFLTPTPTPHGGLAVEVTDTGDLALYLAQLAPAGAIHPDDRAAYAARLGAVPRRRASRDQAKARARRLPALDPRLAAGFEYPLTVTGQRATSPPQPRPS